MSRLIDLALYLLSDEKVQKVIKQSKAAPELLGRFIPLLMKEFFRLDLRSVDRYVKESRNFRELCVRLFDDMAEVKDGDIVEDGRIVQIGSDVPSKDKNVS
jgi:hypothetical protein